MKSAAPPAMALAPHSLVTTGYAWTSAIGDDKVVAYEGNVYQRPGTADADAGAQQLFMFHANRSGSASIAFSYARTLETGVPASKTPTFTISGQ